MDALFVALEDWVEREGARGCLFLRSDAETGGAIPEIAEALVVHKTAFRQRVAEIVAFDLGRDDPDLSEQVIVLLEGATHAAVYCGVEAIRAARAAAGDPDRDVADMSPALRIGAMGFVLIALSYGFARFAFGMFLPQIDAERGLGPVLGSMISNQRVSQSENWYQAIP